MKRIKYNKCIEIKPYIATVWLIEFENGKKELAVWHSKAKIQDLVKAIKLQNPKQKFTVENIDVGHFGLKRNFKNYHTYSHDARKVNQNLRVISPGDEKYDFVQIRYNKKIKKKSKNLRDIPY